MRRSPICNARATTTRRSATPRPIGGRITSRRRSRRCTSHSPQSRVTLITTAAPYRPDKGDQGPGAAYNGGAKFYQVYSRRHRAAPRPRISHIAYDRVHTSAEDSGTWFPLPQLLRAAAAGRIGAVAPRFHGAPTNRSHRTTIETDAPEICRALPGRRRRRRDPGAELPGLPPDRASGRAPPGGERHPDGDHGLRQGHRGACRRCRASCSATSRSAIRAGKPHDVASQAATLELALRCWKPRPARARRAVAVALERRCDVEARLSQHRAHVTRGDRPPPAEFDKQKAAAREIRVGQAA